MKKRERCPACKQPFTADDPAIDVYAWVGDLIGEGEPIARLHETCVVRVLQNMANERRGRTRPAPQGAA